MAKKKEKLIVPGFSTIQELVNWTKELTESERNSLTHEIYLAMEELVK